MDWMVHIVDDDEAVRRSLERLLRATGFATATYPSAQAILDRAPGLPAGCILLDVRMPEMDGLELQTRLDALNISLPVIVMTGYGDVQTAVRAMKAGAIDFIEKPFDDASLVAAIKAALARAGRSVQDNEVLEAAKRIASLSRREREVLDALVAGRPNKMIAFDLGLSVRTVEVHRARMLDRLGVRSLADAVRLSVMATLLSGDPDLPSGNGQDG